jgi:hypothetical protein
MNLLGVFFVRTKVRIARHALFALGLAGLASLAASCDQTVPTPPPATGSSSGSGSKKKTSDDDDDSGSTEQDSGEGEEFGSASGEETTSSGSGDATAASGSGSDAAEPASFKREGAQLVGDDGTKKEVKDCGTSGKLYDRFAATPGCTTTDLAKIDCTADGIKAALAGNDKLLGQFNTALTGSYAGMEVDQCVDCPVGNGIAQCATSKPPTNGGTKVLFVKMDGTKIDGKGMMLPIRPFQK